MKPKRFVEPSLAGGVCSSSAFPTASERPVEARCLNCSSELTLHQPDMDLPERLLGSLRVLQALVSHRPRARRERRGSWSGCPITRWSENSLTRIRRPGFPHELRIRRRFARPPTRRVALTDRGATGRSDDEDPAGWPTWIDGSAGRLKGTEVGPTGKDARPTVRDDHPIGVESLPGSRDMPTRSAGYRDRGHPPLAVPDRARSGRKWPGRRIARAIQGSRDRSYRLLAGRSGEPRPQFTSHPDLPSRERPVRPAGPAPAVPGLGWGPRGLGQGQVEGLVERRDAVERRAASGPPRGCPPCPPRCPWAG